MLSSRPIQLNGDGPYFPTKTPGRGLKNRMENAHAGVGISMTVHGKGKNAMAPKTPFQPSSVQPQRLFKDGKIVLTTNTRPLGDKTPLPNRLGTTLFQTPLPQKTKLSQLLLDDAHSLVEEGGENAGDDNTPGSIQRPSSMRKHIKHPRISGPKIFETPMNNGNHWDISDGDIIVPDTQQLMQETIIENEDDMDEVEYGPPNTLDLPYQPPFDFELPNYKEVGKALRRLAFCVHVDDTPTFPDPDIELESAKWDMIKLSVLESDDPFHLARLESAAVSQPTTHEQQSRHKSNVPDNAIVRKSRPQSSLARLGSTTRSGPPTRGPLAASVAVAEKAGPSKPIFQSTKNPAAEARTVLRATPATSSSTIAKPRKPLVAPSTALNRARAPTTSAIVKTPSIGVSAMARAKPKMAIRGTTVAPTAQTRGTTFRPRSHTSLALNTKEKGILLSSKSASKKTTHRSDIGDDVIRVVLEAVDGDGDFRFDV